MAAGAPCKSVVRRVQLLFKVDDMDPRSMMIDGDATTGASARLACDACGKSCKNDREYGADPIMDEESDFEYAALYAAWGYFSRKDGESYTAILC